MEKNIFNDERATLNHWLARSSYMDKVLAKDTELEAINRDIKSKSDTLTELADFPKSISKDSLKTRILESEQFFKDVSKIGEYYDANGRRISDADFKRDKENCNLLNMKETVKPVYAITKTRVNIRLLPTSRQYFDMANFRHYDDAQGTALDPLEAVIALHESCDKKLIFIVSRYYSGWILRDLADFVEYDVWLKFVNLKDFWVVAENKVTLKDTLFQMGAKIPADFTSFHKSLNKGYLPCTFGNIIRQAFKFLGDGYGWGGMEESVDCSSFVQNVYRSVGVEIPRDADEQENSTPYSVSFKNLSKEERYNIIKNAPVGALLFKMGHVMMFLGVDDENEPIIIHSASSFYDFTSGKPEKKYIRKVLVSNLRLKNKDNIETIDTLTSMGYIRSYS